MKHLFSLVQGGLLAFLVWACPVLAQDVGNFDGHILNQIELVADDQNQHLVIYGSFSAGLLPQIQVIQGEDPTRSMISIPYALVNTMELPSTISFQNSEFLDFIEIEEIVEERAAGDLDFQVNLLITSRIPTVFSFESQQSNSGQLSYLVIGKGATGNIEAETEADTSAELSMSPDAEMGMDMSNELIEPDKVLLHPVAAMMVFQRPSKMHLSILNASPRREDAQRLAILLDRHQRQRFENRVHMKLDITNISSVQEQVVLNKTKIYFRPNFLPAALALAEVIPGEQVVEAMSMERRGRLGLDVEIYVGANFE